jgi:hypothetical protein
MYEIVKISDYHCSITSAWCQSMMCSTSTCYDRLPCCQKKHEKHPQTTLHCLRMYYNRQKHLWSLGKKWDRLPNRKRRLPHLPQSVLSQLSVLKFCSVFTSSLARLDASQSNWQSVFKSAKYVLSDITRDLGYSKVRASGSVRPLQSNIKPRERQFLSKFWHNLKPKETPYPGLLKQLKPWSIILNWKKKKANPTPKTGQ